MKKNLLIYFGIFLGMLSFFSCTEEEGTEPGNDSTPSLVAYQYTVSLPYDVDCDTQIRLAVNNRIEAAYYLVEKSETKAENVASMGMEGYLDYVVEHGTKVEEIPASLNADIFITQLMGEYAITVVGVGDGQKVYSEFTFTGILWTDVATGTYQPASMYSLGLTDIATTLQVCGDDPTTYRFKDLYGTGKHLVVNMLDQEGSDENGNYSFFRIPPTATCWSYGSYGTINVRDVGYWQGNDAYVTVGGYESGMYENYDCFLCIQYYVEAGYLSSGGYGYDYFIAD